MLQIKTSLIIIAILILMSFFLSRYAFGGVVAVSTIKISGKALSVTEYTTLKTTVTSKFDTNTLSFQDGEDWKAVVGNEIVKCPNWIFTNVKDDLLEQLNSRLKLGKC